jgi:hypothetical protein
MEQPDSQQHPDTGSPPAIGRLAALGGLGFLVTSLAGDLLIGAFPRPDTPVSQLVSFYTAHHTQLLAAGMLLALSGIFFALFGVAVWARIRQAASNPMLAGLQVRGDQGLRQVPAEPGVHCRALERQVLTGQGTRGPAGAAPPVRASPAVSSRTKRILREPGPECVAGTVPAVPATQPARHQAHSYATPIWQICTQYQPELAIATGRSVVAQVPARHRSRSGRPPHPGAGQRMLRSAIRPPPHRNR